MGENKRFSIQGSKVSIIIEALKEEVCYGENTSLYFNPVNHCLPFLFVCPGKNI
jgi:hypothetical protein